MYTSYSSCTIQGKHYKFFTQSLSWKYHRSVRHHDMTVISPGLVWHTVWLTCSGYQYSSPQPSYSTKVVDFQVHCCRPWCTHDEMPPHHKRHPCHVLHCSWLMTSQNQYPIAQYQGIAQTNHMSRSPLSVVRQSYPWLVWSVLIPTYISRE